MKKFFLLALVALLLLVVGTMPTFAQDAEGCFPMQEVSQNLHYGHCTDGRQAVLIGTPGTGPFVSYIQTSAGVTKEVVENGQVVESVAVRQIPPGLLRRANSS